jgi:hypothetical protein
VRFIVGAGVGVGVGVVLVWCWWVLVLVLVCVVVAWWSVMVYKDACLGVIWCVLARCVICDNVRSSLRCVGVVRLGRLCIVAMLCTAPCPNKHHVQTGRFTFSGSRHREQRGHTSYGAVGALGGFAQTNIGISQSSSLEGKVAPFRRSTCRHSNKMGSQDLLRLLWSQSPPPTPKYPTVPFWKRGTRRFRTPCA